MYTECTPGMTSWCIGFLYLAAPLVNLFLAVRRRLSNADLLYHENALVGLTVRAPYLWLHTFAVYGPGPGPRLPKVAVRTERTPSTASA
jgi:hypothetical protein